MCCWVTHAGICVIFTLKFAAHNRLLNHMRFNNASSIQYNHKFNENEISCKIINFDQSFFSQIRIERTFGIMEYDVGYVQHNGCHPNSSRIDSCAQELRTLSLGVRSKVSIHFFYQLINDDSFLARACGSDKCRNIATGLNDFVNTYELCSRSYDTNILIWLITYTSLESQISLAELIKISFCPRKKV